MLETTLNIFFKRPAVLTNYNFASLIEPMFALYAMQTSSYYPLCILKHESVKLKFKNLKQISQSFLTILKPDGSFKN